MSNKKKVCIFNEEHFIGNKSLYIHYTKCHEKKFKIIMNNGWFCRGKRTKLFKNQNDMDKHLTKCQICKAFKYNHSDDISFIGNENLKEKLHDNKKNKDLPTFDFEKFKIENNKINNLDLELINALIEEEKNLF